VETASRQVEAEAEHGAAGLSRANAIRYIRRFGTLYSAGLSRAAAPARAATSAPQVREGFLLRVLKVTESLQTIWIASASSHLDRKRERNSSCFRVLFPLSSLPRAPR
jgi:hypothetical protein